MFLINVMCSVTCWKFLPKLSTITPVFYVATTFASTLQGNVWHQKLLLVSLDFFVTSSVEVFQVLLVPLSKQPSFTILSSCFAVNCTYCSVLPLPEDTVILGCCVTRLVAAMFYVIYVTRVLHNSFFTRS